jgi:hypothetical protein
VEAALGSAEKGAAVKQHSVQQEIPASLVEVER